MSTKVLIILPTFNESTSISKILHELDVLRIELQNDYLITILHIDDSSPDGTATIALDASLKDFSQIVNPEKIGLGPAYLVAFEWGLLRDYDFFVEMDCDGSHLASQLPDLLMAAHNHNLVIGTRWIDCGKIENWPVFRKFLSKAGNLYAAKLLKLPFRDLTSGYRVLDREFLKSLQLSSISNKGYGFQIEIAFQAHENGFSIIEIPITFIERSAGKSKMSLGIALEALFFVTRTGFRKSLNSIYRR